MAKDILFIPHNHFDPTWRRCFDRNAVYRGVTVHSYAEVEELCIDAWLALTKRGYSYNEGQAVVLRKYLERNPRTRAVLRKHIKDGRLLVTLAGEVIQDSVLPAAEGLVRNFLVAMPFYRDVVGAGQAGLKLAWLSDAFGNSPNYPQVLKGVGAAVACQLSYHKLAEPIWVGIDGSKLACCDKHPSTFAGGFQKHAPCPTCKGKGCAACGQLGMLLVDGFDMAAVRGAVEKAMALDGEWAVVWFMTEEICQDRRVADLIDELNRAHKGVARIRYATPLDVYRRLQPTLKRALAARDDTPSDDLNPAMPGCMVTRIRCKQRTRAVTYHLVAAEAKLANAAWRRGRPAAPPPDLAAAWRRVAFNQFHDAITGTHIDSAYRELMDMLDEAEAVARKHLPLKPSRPVTGAFKRVTRLPAFRRLGQLDVAFDRCGILSILKSGRDLFGVIPPLNNRRRPCRVAELVLEADFGDAWGKRIAPFLNAQMDISAVPLGDYQTCVEASDGAIRWKGRYTGGDTKVNRLEWTVTASASSDGRRIDFATDVYWDTESKRLRVVVPVRSEEPTATYEVPFGHIDRTFEEAKLDFSQWSSHSMEFPTLHWVRKTVDAASGVALLNKGLPCNRWMPGRLDLSLVRSPEWCFCAEEAANYEFHDLDGQRDTGRHRFEYSLFPYDEGLEAGELTRLGYAYNGAAEWRPPFAVSGDVVVTAWKLAEAGDGWILRLQEAGGRGTTVRLDFDGKRRVTRTDLLERPQGQPRTAARYQTALHRHGILTLHIR